MGHPGLVTTHQSLVKWESFAWKDLSFVKSSSNLSSCHLFTDTCSSHAASWSSGFIHWQNLCIILCSLLLEAVPLMLATITDNAGKSMYS